MPTALSSVSTATYSISGVAVSLAVSSLTCPLSRGFTFEPDSDSQRRGQQRPQRWRRATAPGWPTSRPPPARRRARPAWRAPPCRPSPGFQCASRPPGWAPPAAATRPWKPAGFARPGPRRAGWRCRAPGPQNGGARRCARCPALAGRQLLHEGGVVVDVHYANLAMQPRNCSSPRLIHVFTVPSSSFNCSASSLWLRSRR